MTLKYNISVHSSLLGVWNAFEVASSADSYESIYVIMNPNKTSSNMFRQATVGVVASVRSTYYVLCIPTEDTDVVQK